jgi:hypothetical protein
MASCCTKNCISSSAFVSAQILIVWSSVKSNIDCTKRSFCVQADRDYVNDIFTASLNYSSERKQERSLVSWSMAKQMSFDFVLKFVWKFHFTICSTEVSWYSKLSQILIPISFSAFLHHGSFCKLGDCLVI